MSVVIDGTTGISSPAIDLITPLGAAEGGTGLTAVGASGNVLTSTGTAWQSSPSGVPAGTILPFGGNTAPAGYLLCPLAANSSGNRVTHANLYAALGGASSPWGQGDGVNTFGIPFFPADYALVQQNGNLGTNHVGEVLSHSHSYLSNGLGNPQFSATTFGGINTASTTGSTGGTANLAAGSRVSFIVKF
jgi:hypothetical protein